MEERPRTDYFEGISSPSNRHDPDVEIGGGDPAAIQDAANKKEERLSNDVLPGTPPPQAEDEAPQTEDEIDGVSEVAPPAEDIGISDYQHQDFARAGPMHDDTNDADEAPALVEQPATSPAAAPQTQAELPSKRSDPGVRKMQKFSLYETQARYYLVGGDSRDQQFRMLKIDRQCGPGHINIVEDEIVYTKREMNELLTAIDHGNRAAGGMKLRGNTWGVLGFIRFTEAYYMLIVTKKQQVAMIGGYYVFKIDATELVPLTTGSSTVFERNRNAEELRYVNIFHNLDLNTSFYFSYSYNITRTLQQNVIFGREKLARGDMSQDQDVNDMFVWNHHLLSPAMKHLKNPYDWCLPIIHGTIDQSSVDCFGRQIWVTLVARRSRFFAGARFLKRGANDLGLSLIHI